MNPETDPQPMQSGNRADSRRRASPSDRLSRSQFNERADVVRHALWLVAIGMTNDRHLAEDVVQEALTIAWNKVDQFDPATDFRAWAAAIVRLVAMNARRKAARQPNLSLDHEDAPRPAAATPSGDSPVDPVGKIVPDQSQFDDRVIGALARLNEVARACLLLRTVEGLSYDEIAATLDVPPGTAMSHVHRSRKTMRDLLADTAAATRPAGHEGAAS